MKQIMYVPIVLATFSVLAMGSCSKERNPDSNPANRTAVEMTSQKAISDALIEDVSMEVFQASKDNGFMGPESMQQTCAVITASSEDTFQWPKTITIDYGTTGCVGPNGYVRKGKIIYTASQLLYKSGTVLDVSFENYSVNGYKLEGQYRITSHGYQPNFKVTMVLTNGKVTNPDGLWYLKTSNTTWELTAGRTTYSNPFDDEYTITGSGTITSMDGEIMTATTLVPLLRKVVCENTVSGRVELALDRIAGMLDFGAGTCDKNAVVTVDGKEYEITLP